MRYEWTWLDVAMIVAIGIVAALNVFLYTLIYDSPAVALGDNVANIPGGSAPGIDARRTAAEAAEQDNSAALPGRFVPNQGRQHVNDGRRVAYCGDGPVTNACYSTVPPTSGLHLGVQRSARLSDGNVINVPPDPNVYDFPIPREVVAHIQEHAGVFLGYNCASADCRQSVSRTERLVLGELALGARVVMAPFADLPEDTIALASWTRLDDFTPTEYTDERVRDFIKAHSCRFDPEGFCDEPVVN